MARELLGEWFAHSENEFKSSNDRVALEVVHKFRCSVEIASTPITKNINNSPTENSQRSGDGISIFLEAS